MPQGDSGTDYTEVSAALRRDGFAIVRGCVDGLALREKAEVYEDTVIPRKNEVEVRREKVDTGSTQSGRGGRVVHVMDTYETPSLARVAANPKLVKLASACLGGSGVRPVMNPELFDKPPGGNSSTLTNPHQDNFYFEAPDPDSVIAVWISLDDVNDTSGTLRYVLGSHHHGLRAHTFSEDCAVNQAGNLKPALGPTGFKRHIRDYSDAEILLEKTAGHLQPGDAVIHHSLTIHSAPTNTTGCRRRSLAINYVTEQAAFALADGFEQPVLMFRVCSKNDKLVATLLNENRSAHMLTLAAASVECALVGWRGVDGGIHCTVAADESTGELVVKLPDAPMRRQAVVALVKSGHFVQGADVVRSLPLHLGDFTVPPLPSASYVLPQCYAGVWALVREEVPPGHHIETTEMVMWLQTLCGVYVDIRIPKIQVESRAHQRRSSLSSEMGSGLAEQYSFAGMLSAHGSGSNIAVWHRLTEFHPPNGIADVGRMSWEGEEREVLVESSMPGHYRDYVETWHRDQEPLDMESIAALELVDDTDARHGYWVVVGSWFGRVIGRRRDDLMANVVCKSLAHAMRFLTQVEGFSCATSISGYSATLGRVEAPGILRITHDFDPGCEGSLLLDGGDRQLRRDALDDSIIVEPWAGRRWKVHEFPSGFTAFGKLKRSWP